jgi:hypothetical protein
MTPNSRLVPFSNVFVPWGLLFAWSLVVAELAPDLYEARAQYTARVMLLTGSIAVGLFLWRQASQVIDREWRWSWTAGWLTYVAHLYFALGMVFHGNLSSAIEHQGWAVAGPNLLLALWWGIDVFLAWWTSSPGKLALVSRWGVHLLFVVATVLSTIPRRTGLTLRLGWICLAIPVAAAVARFARSRGLLQVGCRQTLDKQTAM